MFRCGFDAFAVRADKDINDALKAFDEFSERYQGATDNPRTAVPPPRRARRSFRSD